MVSKRNEYLELLYFALFAGVIGAIIPVTFLLAGKGGEVSQFMDANRFYLGMGAFSLILVGVLRLIEIIKGQKGYFFTWIYDPEKALPPFNKLSFSNYVKAGIIIFTLMGFSAAYFNTVLFGLPKAQFQVSPVTMWVLNTEPAAMTETLFFLVNMSLIGTLVYYLAKKFVSPRIQRKHMTIAFIIILSLVMGFAVVQYHNLVYSADEAGQLAVFVLGAAGAAMTIVTGSVLWWWMFHFANNFFVSLNPYFSNEAILLWAVVVVAAEIVLFYGRDVYGWLAKPKRRVR